jgi:MFS family permease
MYTIMAFAVGPLTKKFNSRRVSFCSYIVTAIGCFIFGPSRLFGLDSCLPVQNACYDANYSKEHCIELFKECVKASQGERTAFTVVGLLVLGGGTGTVVVPILLELVSSIKESMGATGGPQANDKASGLFTMSSALGTIIGPIVGGLFFDLYGVQTTCDIFGLSSLAMGLLFFIMNIWPGLLLKKKADAAKTPAAQNQQLIQITPNPMSPSQLARKEKEEENRIILSVRGSSAIDMVIPATEEHKMYLAGIEEGDEDNEESRTY